ncbi:hypothetical protein MT356_10490 [Rathayibacter festucae]|jgi:hypothetical protein|uniref:hypothetical protein n=1 Tax=Rathayibacter TaxID=33886 RepID=UPI000F464C78|nr:MULTISPECIES: hypothetical protein [Rathayibacter]MCJ1700145.1 hypothetical protein [Rathayibacter festucae]ROQ06722.1 hypothetical protein EDF54_1691 [Rathayibacter sp. PhB93]TDQ14479.1 hypothetical protein EDF17_1510 [Rathayibacter sp. PhB1]TDX78874.1 hypothetical protein EDF35_2097 [Rathayibacter sp. PhB151]
MTTPRPVSRRTATTAALWSAPVLLAASAAPLAAASGEVGAALGVSGGLSNGGGDLYAGQFTPVVSASQGSEPVRDIVARVTFDTGDSDVVLSDFVLEEGPWVVVEPLGSRTPGVVVLAWSDATGLRDGESPVPPQFSVHASGYIVSCLVELSSTSAAPASDYLIIAVV